MRALILQPLIPHYREDFFKQLLVSFSVDIYCYETNQKGKDNGFSYSAVFSKSIRCIRIGPILIYNPITVLMQDYDILVLMLHFGHVSTWLLLITKFIHRRKIVLWGHGISVKRYYSEEKNPSVLLKWMIGLADLVWLYTEKEVDLWRRNIRKSDHIVSIDNTVSNVSQLLSYNSLLSKDELKLKYSILEKRIFIYCARFTLEERRADILVEVIRASNPGVGFVIIGDGPFKPDFSEFSNVYEFGSLYDESIKKDLFSLADVYIQPGWLGLSIVEAMAYGLPVFTMKREAEIKQCVEYFYLEDSKAGLILDSVKDFVEAVNSVDQFDLTRMGVLAKSYVGSNLLMENMVGKAVSSIQSLKL